MRQGQLTIELKEFENAKKSQTENYRATFGVTGDDLDDLLPIDLYWDYCRRFAAVLGFSEKTINEWFGKD